MSEDDDDPSAWMNRVAFEIGRGNADGHPYFNMGLTLSEGGEYTDSRSIIDPIPPAFPIKNPDPVMTWRPAACLLVLLHQVDAKWPGRDKSSDGMIGDASHRATKSDHNPDDGGVVRALDITNDPEHGPKARALAEALVASRDPRIKYIISNAQIISSQMSPWIWRPYSGSNAHREHVHISVVSDNALADDTRPWKLDGTQPVEPPARPGVNTRITATNFRDNEVAYTDVAPGWNDRFGVALPFRFKGPRPKVKVTNRANGKSIICEIMDIGPWYDDRAGWPYDPYWQTGSRPRSESDPRTNGAGIDLTIPADEAIGLGGKGLVDWEFVTADGVIEPPPPILIDAAARLQTQINAILKRLDQVEADIKILKEAAVPDTNPQQPQVDWGAVLKPLLDALAPQLTKLLPQILPALMPLIVQLLTQWISGRIAAPAPVTLVSAPKADFPMGSVLTTLGGLLSMVVSGWATSRGYLPPEVGIPTAVGSAVATGAGGVKATENMLKPKT